MPVINAQTGQPEDLDPLATTEGLASGKYLPPPGTGVLVNPDGDLVFVPAEDVRENVARYGYKIPLPDELRKLGRDYKYSSDVMQLQAGLAGAARGATLGASDYLAIKTGITSPEHLSALKQYFPATTVATEIAGTVAPSFIPGGVFTPAGAIGKLALGAEAQAVGKIAASLPKNAMANTIAKAAVETGGKALGGAIEGLAFGLGQTVSEASLGDPDLTAEKIVANIGHSAVLGGAFGAAFKVGGIAAGKALERAKKTYQSAYEKLIGRTVVGADAVGDQAGRISSDVATLGDDLADDVVSKIKSDIAEEQAQAAGQPVFEPGILTKKLAKLSSATSGVPEEEIIEKFAAEMDPERIVLNTAQKDAKVKEFGDSMQALYDEARKLTKRMSASVRPQEMENLLVGIDAVKPMQQLQDLQDRLGPAVQAMKAKSLKYNQAIRSDMEELAEQLESRMAGGFTDSFSVYKELVEARRVLEGLEKFNKKTLTREEANAINEFVTPIRSLIREGLMDEKVWGEAGARQSAYNQRFTALQNWTEALERSIMVKSKVGTARYITEVNPTKINTMFNQINGNRSKIPARATINFLKSFREYIEEAEKSLANAPQVGMDIRAVKDLAGKLSDDAMNAKKYVSDAFGGYGFFTDLMDAAKSGGLGGMAAQIGTAFTNPDWLVKRLSEIEKASNQASKAMNRVKTIFEKAKVPTKGAFIKAYDAATQEERVRKYKDYVDKLKNLTDVPDYLLERLDRATFDSFEAAPKITASLQMALVRGISFLQEKMPRPIDQSLLDTPYEPSPAEMLQFNRYVAVVENPQIVIDQIIDNYVPKESLETLERVYPSYYSELKTQILSTMADSLANGKLDVPYQRRVVLSRVLGMPLDSSFKPDVIRRNQEAIAAAYGQAKAEEAAAQRPPSQAGLDKVSLASRFQTRSEKIMTREA